jgi:hypothetical protein
VRPLPTFIALTLLACIALGVAALASAPERRRGARVAPRDAVPPPSRREGTPTGAARDRTPPDAPRPASPAAAPDRRITPQIGWRRSTAVGLPWAGRLLNGVRLPARGRHFRTWDPVLKRSPGRPWRRFGTDRLVRVILRAAASYRRARPTAPPVLVGDLSRPHGGDFGPHFGSIGHMTHQNGLDVDVYYPRRDRRQAAARRVDQVDLRLAQALVDHFVAAGAATVLVGPNTGLGGPPAHVKPFPNHDDHLHARILP